MKKYVAEALGTGFLVLVGCGTAVVVGAPNLVGIALAFGLVVLAMVYAIGPISGCHINPAVSVAMCVAGKLSVKDMVGYVIAQVVGAILGAGLLLLIFQGHPGYDLATQGLGQNSFGAASALQFPLQSALIAEVVFTALFLFVIFGATQKKAHEALAGVAIGFSLVFIHLATIPITGTSVNPARSIGPAVFVQGAAVEQLWLFIVAPILGAVIAALVWRFLTQEPKKEQTEEKDVMKDNKDEAEAAA